MEKIHCQRESRYRRDREQMYKRQRGDTLEIEKICREQMQMRQTENRCIRDREQMSEKKKRQTADVVQIERRQCRNLKKKYETKKIYRNRYKIYETQIVRTEKIYSRQMTHMVDTDLSSRDRHVRKQR